MEYLNVCSMKISMTTAIRSLNSVIAIN